MTPRKAEISYLARSLRMRSRPRTKGHRAMKPKSQQILVVEDDADSREALATLLQIHGFDVVAAENGKVALETIRRDLPSLILLDLQMPVMDGYAVLSRLAQDPRAHNVPVVVTT